MPSRTPKQGASATSSTDADPDPQPKRASKPASGRSKYQTGEVRTIARDQIKLAAYNPRQISKDALRRLRDNLRKVGLVGPSLVWNEATGNLVSGHKRLAALDVLEDGTGYQLDVTAVNWPLEKEKRQNVFFNNQFAQGEFDAEALAELLSADLEHLEAFGFDTVEVQHLFPDDERFGDLFKEAEPEQSTMPEAKAVLDEIEQDKDNAIAENKALKDAAAAERVKERRAEQAAVLDAANATDFYVIIVCKDGDEAGGVLRALGVSEESRYVSAAQVVAAVRRAEA